MRVGPFSNRQFNAYIQQHFVPVFVSNQKYAAGDYGPEELKHLVTIRRKTTEKGMRTATVQIYLLTPDGDPVDIMVVRDALDFQKLMPFIRKNVAAMKVVPGEQLIASKDAQNWIEKGAPKTNKEQLKLRFAAQYRPRQKIMVEDWIVLDKQEWSAFLPPETGATEWTIPDEVTRKILVRVYPYVLNWDHDTDQIKNSRLDAKVLTSGPNETLIGIRGELAMTHLRYVKAGLTPVTSQLTGYITVTGNNKPRIKIITEGARFGEQSFEGMLLSMNDS